MAQTKLALLALLALLLLPLAATADQRWCEDIPLCKAARHGRTAELKALLTAPGSDVGVSSPPSALSCRRVLC